MSFPPQTRCKKQQIRELQSSAVYFSVRVRVRIRVRVRVSCVLVSAPPPSLMESKLLLAVRSSRGGALTFRGVSGYSSFYSRAGSAHTNVPSGGFGYSWVGFQSVLLRIEGGSRVLCGT